MMRDRVLPYLLALVAGCYAPVVDSGKFTCDSETNFCPDGQICVPVTGKELRRCVTESQSACWDKALECATACRDANCLAACRITIADQGQQIKFGKWGECIVKNCQENRSDSHCGPKSTDVECSGCINATSFPGGACETLAKACQTP